jgi:2-polyprenyl-3-methyl-5-hydroxy-6-metoxy-1,4-benzoquinol methylase
VTPTCIVCGSNALENFAELPYFGLFACRECQSATALPRPKPSESIALHDSAEYFEHPYFVRRRADAHRARLRCAAIGQKLGPAAATALRGRKHLDIGCDTGSLLEAAARLFGTCPTGIDVSGRAVALAREAGIEAHRSDLSGVPQLRGFSLVTIVDVLEHVAEPQSFMRDVERCMEPGGYCYIETPNLSSSIYRIGRVLTSLTGARPAWICQRLFLPEHVQYVSAAGIRHLATAAQLRVQELGRRCLSTADINTVLPVKLAAAGLQTLDRAFGTELLHWAVLRKPAT